MRTTALELDVWGGWILRKPWQVHIPLSRPPVFIAEGLLAHSPAHSLMCCVSCFLAVIAKLSSFKNLSGLQSPKHLLPGFYRKCLPHSVTDPEGVWWTVMRPVPSPLPALPDIKEVEVEGKGRASGQRLIQVLQAAAGCGRTPTLRSSPLGTEASRLGAWLGIFHGCLMHDQAVLTLL